MRNDNRDVAIVNGRVVTGDGMTVYDVGTLVIRNGLIASIMSGGSQTIGDAQVVDASGCTVMPGIINGHAHGCVTGPAMPSGSAPFASTDIEYFRNRHLLAGTTTLLNVCGLALTEEVSQGDMRDHPLDVAVSTAHTASNLAAAAAIDGEGLSGQHYRMTIDKMIAGGAKALGEAGGGQTLGGGAQDYRFIPQAVQAATGIIIHPRTARAFKEAIVGRRLDRRHPDLKAVGRLLEEAQMLALIDSQSMVDLIVDTVMPPVALSLLGFEEIAFACAQSAMPGIFHNAAPTAGTISRLARAYPKARMIAAHSNHPSFMPDECLAAALTLKARGVTIDVSTLDCITTRWRNDPVNLDLLVSEKIANTLSTDFAGGNWDSILDAIHRIVRLGQLTLPQAIALATGNVSQALPELAGDRGVLAKGRRADLAIVENHNLARVRHVIKNGRLVVTNGAVLR